MPTPFEFLLIAFATWRLASFLIYEDGPFEIFKRWRKFVKADVGEIHGQLPTLFTCIWCLSVWMAVFVYLFWRFVWDLPIMLLAVTTVVLITEGVVSARLDRH